MKTTFVRTLLFHGLRTILVSRCLFTREIWCGNTRKSTGITLARTLLFLLELSLRTRLIRASLGLLSSIFSAPKKMEVFYFGFVMIFGGYTGKSQVDLRFT